MRLSGIMKVHVVSGTLEISISQIVDLMDLYQISHVPIVDCQSTPVGMITIDRISRCKESELRNSDLRSFMMDELFTLDENCTTEEAESMLLGNELRRLCVTSGSKLVGTVGWVELCQFRLLD